MCILCRLKHALYSMILTNFFYKQCVSFHLFYSMTIQFQYLFNLNIFIKDYHFMHDLSGYDITYS